MPEKFDPLRELANLRNSVGRVLEQGVQSVQSLTGQQSIRLDVYEVEDTVVVRTSAIDGVVADSIDVSMENDTLTISGDTRPEPTPTNASYLVQERRFGPFRAVWPLVCPSDLQRQKPSSRMVCLPSLSP